MGLPPKISQVNFYGVKITSERLMNTSIYVFTILFTGLIYWISETRRLFSFLVLLFVNFSLFACDIPHTTATSQLLRAYHYQYQIGGLAADRN